MDWFRELPRVTQVRVLALDRLRHAKPKSTRDATIARLFGGGP